MHCFLFVVLVKSLKQSGSFKMIAAETRLKKKPHRTFIAYEFNIELLLWKDVVLGGHRGS